MIHTIEQLINNSELTQLQKSMLIGSIKRNNAINDKMQDDITLIKNVSSNVRINKVILSTDEVKIYTVYSVDSDSNDWDVKYPFRMITCKNQHWNRHAVCSPSLDLIYLSYLQYKYLNDEPGFVKFVSKMLDMPIVE